MILAVDVGNTNIVLGVFDGEELVLSGRLSTNTHETYEECAMRIHSFLSIHNSLEIDGAIVSSVVPSLNHTIKKAIRLLTGVDTLIVGPGIKTGLPIKIDNPSQLGADIVVGAVAAKAKYPCPIIVFDLGTATTGFVIDKEGSCIGGMIAAGVISSINALSNGTAQLPQIDLTTPESAIGANTIDSMRSGAVLGTASMLDGFVDRFERELGEKASVVVTGGLSKPIIKACQHEMNYEGNLLLDGLRIIYNKNI